MLKVFVRKLIVIAALATAIFSCELFAGDYKIEFQPVVTERAAMIEHKGVLKQKSNGYLYLEVSNDFIGEILPLIIAPGTIVPPHHYTTKTGIGAHISVMYEDEQINNDIWEIAELGQEFIFSVMDLRTVKVSMNSKTRKLWMIAVHAPELQQLRMSYGLPPKLKGHDFHITVGSQVPGKAKITSVKDKEAA